MVRHTGISGHRLVPRIARKTRCSRMTDDARQERGGLDRTLEPPGCALPGGRVLDDQEASPVIVVTARQQTALVVWKPNRRK